MPHVTLVTGGNRSGKSGWAQTQAEAVAQATGAGLAYLATCPRLDTEMDDRITRHQADRTGRGWQTIEEELQLTEAIATLPAEQVLLIDCLTLWLNNLLYHQANDFGENHEDQAREQALALATACRQRSGPCFLVTNELGQGVIAADPLTRRFVDCSGRMNQTIAALADRVVLLVCGQPIIVKGMA